MNRSKHLEGKGGFYDGKPITSAMVFLQEKIEEKYIPTPKPDDGLLDEEFDEDSDDELEEEADSDNE